MRSVRLGNVTTEGFNVQHLQSISEDEMVAVFLKTEIASSRFRAAILATLARHGRDPRIVEQPTLTSCPCSCGAPSVHENGWFPGV
jgi:hypothetical protein